MYFPAHLVICLGLLAELMIRKFYSKLILLFFFGYLLSCGNAFSGQEIYLTSPSPVGSGARALGMGGAFISIADDATAASWNPGGLVQLKRPELSIVNSILSRSENFESNDPSEAYTSERIDKTKLNYFSTVLPFSLLNRNMVIALNYQNLFDFERRKSTTGNALISHSKRNGSLSPYGIAYAIQITPHLSFGITLNFWRDTNGMNTIENNNELMSGTIRQHITITDRINGFNTNFGALWRPFDSLSIGMVYKTRLYTDVKRVWKEKFDNFLLNIVDDYATDILNLELILPESYGIGISYKWSDTLKLAADMYQTPWKEFVMVDQNDMRLSAITGDLKRNAAVTSTTQFRTGIEYLHIRPNKRVTIAFRGGFFYDPLPNENDPSDTYGVSIGVGFSTSQFSIDLFYQYKFGRDMEIIDDKLYAYPSSFYESLSFISVIYYL